MNVRRMGVSGLAGLMAMVVAGALAATMGAPTLRAAESRAQILVGGEQQADIPATTDETRQQQDKDKKDEKKDDKKDDKQDEKKGLPLKPDHKITFTTDEGTWLSLDVSPDGKTIVFELMGDLYTLPIEGGQAKLISGGMAFDSQPRFSPDGQWVTFISDREGSENIWIIHPDGTGVKQVSKNSTDDFSSPAWTPDGKYIVASKMPFGIGANELWMFHVDGGTGVQITKSKPTPTTLRKDRPNAMGVVASPDGKYLYYALRKGPFSYNAQFPLWTIVRRDRKTGDEDEIIAQPESAFRPTLSPDGKQLVYVTRYETETGLRLRNLETGEDHWVKYPVTRDDQESRFTRDVFPGFAFLPGGKEIVYNQDGKIRRLNLASGTEKIIPFTAEVSQDIGPKLDFPQRVEEGPVKVRLIMDPVESPDGKRLAFSAMTHVYTMDLPNGKAGAIDQRQWAGISAGVVAGWEIDRVCDVVERRRTAVEGGGRRWQADATVEVAGGVQQSGVVAGWNEDRGAARQCVRPRKQRVRWRANGKCGSGVDSGGRRRRESDFAGARSGRATFHAREGSHLCVHAAGTGFAALRRDGSAHAPPGERARTVFF